MDSPPAAAAAPGGTVPGGPVSGCPVLGGRYRLRSLLGSGGMAQVYDGWDERLARPVAVKLLRADLAAQPDLRRRFALEARAAARLSHPNVVAVYDAGDDNGRTFIVMERLRGESLADCIRNGPVDQMWLRRLAGEVLSALEAAHQAGVIHRDIKPGNILLGPDGRAKVADFGIARVVEEVEQHQAATALTGAGLVVGTTAYLAPERAMGQPATPRSDLYSVGVVLYEALTGRKPFTGETPVAVAAAAVRRAAPDPSSLRPDADPQLVAVIGCAMDPDPERRYATSAHMAADLRGALPPRTSVMVAAPPLPGPAAAAPPGRAAGTRVGAGSPPPHTHRARIVAVAVAVTVMAVAVGLVVLGPRWGLWATSSTSATPPATAAVPTTAAPTTAPAPALNGPPATTDTTTTTPPVPAASDPVAVALASIATHVAGSNSEAAPLLAAGLENVAQITDPAARAAAATNLLSQAEQWYEQGELSAGDFVLAEQVLEEAGAPPATFPIGTHGHRGGGGGAGG